MTTTQSTYTIPVTTLVTAAVCAAAGYIHCRWHRLQNMKDDLLSLEEFVEACRQAKFMMQLPFVHSEVLLENKNVFQFTALMLDSTTSVTLTVDRLNQKIIVVKGGDARRYSYPSIPWPEIEAWLLENHPLPSAGSQTLKLPLFD